MQNCPTRLGDAPTDPWSTLGYLRDDLRQARAIFEPFKPLSGDLKRIEALVTRALSRIGDGTLEGQS